MNSMSPEEERHLEAWSTAHDALEAMTDAELVGIAREFGNWDYMREMIIEDSIDAYCARGRDA